MIFLDIPLDVFFKKYPALKSQAEIYSRTHKFKVSEMRPFVSKNVVGVYVLGEDGCPIKISIVDNRSLELKKNY